MENDTIIVKCAGCGTKNRIPKSRMNDQPVCGRCGAPIRLGEFFDRPVNITDQTFSLEVLSASGPVLVDCWAPWCGPCKTVAPILDQLAREYAGRVKIAKLNVDENPETASKYAIRSIPTMMLFKNGQKMNALVGALPKAEIERALKAAL
ncbi:MAG: thioredoxin TrxC [Deltaproteobacteria bacterium]|jgi:thioredoxin 2